MMPHMSTYVVKAALLCITLISYANSDQPMKWDYDVYTGRHFDTLVTSTTADDDVIVSPTILVLYGPECHTEARAIRDSLRPWGPMDKYLTLTFHDYVTYPRHIWYDLDHIDDLKQRYMLPEDDCLKVLFFDEGGRLSRPEVWDYVGEIYDWAWGKVLLDLPFFNALDEKIIVQKEGQGSAWVIGTLEPMSDIVANTHMGLAVTVYDLNKTLLYGVWIEQLHRFSSFAITQELVDGFQNNYIEQDNLTWVKEMREIKNKDSATVRDSQWRLAESFLLCFKQPVLLPKFTETGYFKTAIPADAYTALKNFYDTTKATNGVTAESSLSGPTINSELVMTGIVQLDDAIRQLVYKALLNQMQEWCQCELEQTFFYGIREYYKGNVLRMHVDRVETHVISSILQIDQDLGESSDWNLEIIDFNGKRQNVTLHPGEMLLYESATLIHGRPYTFHGNFFANCFLHYKPVSNWNWERKYSNDIGYVITNNDDVTERGDVINTINSFKTVNTNVRVEL